MKDKFWGGCSVTQQKNPTRKGEKRDVHIDLAETHQWDHEALSVAAP